MQAFLARPAVLPGLIAAAGLGALAVALAAQYWGGLAPCVLCIYQRYAHGAAAGAGLVALALVPAGAAGRRAAVALSAAGALAFLAGAAIAGFHVGVEQHWWQGTAGCHAPTFEPDLSIDELREAMLATRFAPCDEVAWALFGISMAGYNFLFSLALGAGVLWLLARQRRAERP